MRIAHLAWAVISLVLCTILVVAGGGHPPPIVLLPAVVVVWAVGHGVIWGTERLARRGRASAEGEGVTARPWPLGLKLALVATGAAVLIGVVQFVGSAFLGRPYPFHGFLWLLTMAVWVLHGTCFAGLLLRRGWSKLLSAIIAIGWSLVMAVQIIDYAFSDQRINLMELSIGAALMISLVAFGLYLLLSKDIDMFIAKNGEIKN